MLRTKLRNLTLLAVAVVLVVAWMSSPDGDSDGDDDRWRQLSFEVAVVGPGVESVDVAIAASLGSAGAYSNKKQKIWSENYSDRRWSHRFRARVGDRLNGEVANLNVGAPLDIFLCFFYQQGVGVATSRHGVHQGFGHITDNFGGKRGELARCNAVVHP